MRLMTCSPSRVGWAHGRPSFLVRRFPQAPQRVQAVIGISPSVLMRVCPRLAKAGADSLKLIPVHLWCMRYLGIVLAVT